MNSFTSTRRPPWGLLGDLTTYAKPSSASIKHDRVSPRIVRKSLRAFTRVVFPTTCHLCILMEPRSLSHAFRLGRLKPLYRFNPMGTPGTSPDSVQNHEGGAFKSAPPYVRL